MGDGISRYPWSHLVPLLHGTKEVRDHKVKPQGSLRWLLLAQRDADRIVHKHGGLDPDPVRPRS